MEDSLASGIKAKLAYYGKKYVPNLSDLEKREMIALVLELRERMSALEKLVENLDEKIIPIDEQGGGTHIGLDELNHISLTDEDIENWFDNDPTNDDPEE